MVSSRKVKEAVEWYSQNKFIYEAVCKKVEPIIEDALKLETINFYSVTSRAKSIESYKAKASKSKYKNPKSEIMDMAGIRIITYTESDAKRVLEIVKKILFVYPNTSSDKTEKLGFDRVGYRSLDCIASLGKARIALIEYSLFKDVCFEIQMRTILQHAWAEFEHDRNYKFSVELPDDLKRRLFRIAGSLETVDKEFDNLSKEIDTYKSKVEKGIYQGALDIPINSLSLTAYFSEKFKDLINEGLVATEIGRGKDRIFDDLKAMNIENLKELDELIPKDFSEKARPHYQSILEWTEGEKFLIYPVLLDIFIISNVELYFEKVWKNSWQGIQKEEISLYEEYGVNIKKYIELYNMQIL